MRIQRDGKSGRVIRRLLHLAILGAAGALLIQASLVAPASVAARSDDARAVEAGRRSDRAATRRLQQAALKFRMDEMRQRRRGRRQQRDEKLQRLTPDEHRRGIDPKPLRRRPRRLDDALERATTLRHRLDGPTTAVRR